LKHKAQKSGLINAALERALIKAICSGLTPEQIAFINARSSAAFISPLFWALCFNLCGYIWKSLIPIYGFNIWRDLTRNGRKIAWNEKKWNSFKQFYRRELIATIISLVALFAILIILGLLEQYL